MMESVHKTVVNHKLNSFFYECLISLLQITTFMMISDIRFVIFSESHLYKCFKVATGKKMSYSIEKDEDFVQCF